MANILIKFTENLIYSYNKLNIIVKRLKSNDKRRKFGFLLPNC